MQFMQNAWITCHLQDQASWACEYDEVMVMLLEQNLRATLQQPQTIEQWAIRLRDVVNTVLKPCDDENKFVKVARKFLLKWSFYRWEKCYYDIISESSEIL